MNNILPFKKLNIILTILVVLLSVVCKTSRAQQLYTVNAILDSIERYNPISRMFETDIRSMDEASKGARSWMPPEIGAGLFMTPYNPKLWKKMSDMEPGMGAFMVSLQQMIPNRKKLDADEAYMKSMSAAATEQKNAALNELYAKAKKAYYEWMIIEKKKSLVNENEKVLDFMVKNAEIRYRNGMDQLDAYYKASAALGKIQSMRIMLDNESRQRRIILNTLMNRNTGIDFMIDTSLPARDYNSYVPDSSMLLKNRSDLRAIEREIITNQFRIQSEKQNLKPQFGIRFDHMIGFGAQPQQFTLMGMLRLPMVPWASRMTKANMESYRWRMEALNSQKQMIINESLGMAEGMKTEIEAKNRQVLLFENNIIPALKNNYKAMLVAYEQNTQELFMLFDAWETLNMTQVEYLDQLQQLLSLKVELERILEIR